jgi:uncharacterized protein YndB with AHSA1/START domain
MTGWGRIELKAASGAIKQGAEQSNVPAAQRTILIHRPPEQVFAFFTDPANDLRWRSHVKEASAQGQVAVGSSVHQVVAGPGGRSIPADYEVTSYDPPSRYGFKVTAGPARPVGEFRFAPDGLNTHVSFSLNAELKGIKKIFMAKPVQKAMDSEMASLDKAKALIEQA